MAAVAAATIDEGAGAAEAGAGEEVAASVKL